MFSCCSSLKSLNLSSFNTNDYTNIGSMFINCNSLKLLDLSLFNESNFMKIKSNLSYNGTSTNIIIINKYDKTKNDF